jgi:DNA-binding Lrp family transcriptional regulator
MLLNNKILNILEEFCLDYNKKIYGRQVANKLKMNQKTVSNILNQLEKEDILKYSTEGKNKYYFLNMANPQIKDIIKMLEIARKNKFIQKYSKLKDLFYALEKRANGILVIFGSYANFTSNKDSDLDIFVIGRMGNIEDLENFYKIKINIVKSSKEKINKKDIFVREIIKNHIIIKGAEEFVELIW